MADKKVDTTRDHERKPSVADKKVDPTRDYERKPSVGWYRVIRLFFTLVLHTIWPLKVKGARYVPRQGAAIVVANHLSYIDPFVIGYSANRLVSYMGKKELFGMPFVGFLLRRVGGFPVDRSRPDAASMKVAMTVLKDGELLGLFPEGTRGETGEMQELRSGAARLAARMRVPILPAAVSGTERALPKGKLPRPARVRVAFGPPFELTELYNRNDKGEAMERAVEQIRERIEALQRQLA
ncbi:MAG: 1-acyl-sn-glycerol-3-phosphate acyltransferase [Chloroflexota bacterium]|nr:1-acyl-sn-glycerol-3-phosphate acyltransferase [Chloroflexota bacterium]